ncbi:putative nuclear factor related to kappa-B-binding protein [Dioscorea sansibarensis]
MAIVRSDRVDVSRLDSFGLMSDDAETSGSDDCDVSELGEVGAELCRVGNQGFNIPFELCDLEDLGSVLSVETWNDCLSEEERFRLAEFLPDMEQETLWQTLAELFEGKDFHFGSPMASFFSCLKSGFFEPKVEVYRRGLIAFQRRQHYYFLKEYQDSMVKRLVDMKDVWEQYEAYAIEDRVRLLNSVCNQRRLNRDVNLKRGFLKQRDKKRSKKTAMGDCPNYYELGFDMNAKQRKLLMGNHWSSLDQIDGGGSDSEDLDYKAGMHGVQSMSRDSAIIRPRRSKSGKKQEFLRDYDATRRFGIDYEGHGGYAQLSHHRGGSKKHSDVTVACYDDELLYKRKRAKYSENDSVYSGREVASVEHPVKFADLNIRSQKPREGEEFRNHRGRTGSHSALAYGTTPQMQMSDLYSYSGQRSKTSQEQSRSKLARKWEMPQMGMHYSRSSSLFDQQEDELYDSSDLAVENKHGNLLVEQHAYSSENMEEGHLVDIGKMACDPRKADKLMKKNKKLNGGSSKHAPDAGPYFSESRHQKGDKHDLCYQSKSKSRGRSFPLSKKLGTLPSDSYNPEIKRKATTESDHPWSVLDYEKGSLTAGTHNHMPYAQSRVASRRVRSSMPLAVCNSTGKEEKVNLHSIYPNELDESVHSQSISDDEVEQNFLKGDGNRKADSGFVSLAAMTPPLVTSDKEAMETQAELGSENMPFTLITPTVYNCFSFSVIHLLSAVRRALIADTKDKSEFCIPLQNDDSAIHPQRNVSVNTPDNLAQKSVPVLYVSEIVSRVKSNPGDPCILEAQEPLQELVRGVLKIFSSKTAPLGAEDWKALVSYEKSNKSWSWVGPLPSMLSDEESTEERTSSEAWGIPHKLLVKLVDAFSNWLKSVQDTLQQIGCLPSLPLSMFPTLDEKERFRDLKSQKNPNTISPSRGEVRAHFQREEFLRYSVSDRAFLYTAADGKKSSVAPLKNGGGKPKSRAREHFMLKVARPAHVTILCLVRDAAARLPGSIGTRADISTLLRDSQYIVDNVSDSQINQVVSGALDRLHSQRDPCVQFDNDRKLWVYLHREREEEDFEDDGTSSTKKWKRPKKSLPGNSYLEAVNDFDSHATGNPTSSGSPGDII